MTFEFVGWKVQSKNKSRRIEGEGFKLENGEMGVLELHKLAGGGRSPISRVLVVGSEGSNQITFRNDIGSSTEILLRTNLAGLAQVPQKEYEINKKISAMSDHIHASRHTPYTGYGDFNAYCHVPAWSAAGGNLPGSYWTFESLRPPSLNPQILENVAEASAWWKGYDSFEDIPSGGELDCILMEAISLLALSMDYYSDYKAEGVVGDFFSLPRNGFFRGDCEDLAKEIIYFWGCAKQTAPHLKGPWGDAWRSLFARYGAYGMVCSAFTDRPINHLTVCVYSYRDKLPVGVLEGTAVDGVEAIPFLDTPQRKEREKGKKIAAARYTWAPPKGQFVKTEDFPSFYRYITELWSEDRTMYLVKTLGGTVGVPFMDFYGGKFDLEPYFVPEQKYAQEIQEILTMEPPKVKLAESAFSKSNRQFEGEKGGAICTMERKSGALKAKEQATLTFKYSKTYKTQLFLGRE
jgi:hypothetical protein